MTNLKTDIAWLIGQILAIAFNVAVYIVGGHWWGNLVAAIACSVAAAYNCWLIADELTWRKRFNASRADR